MSSGHDGEAHTTTRLLSIRAATATATLASPAAAAVVQCGGRAGATASTLDHDANVGNWPLAPMSRQHSVPHSLTEMAEEAIREGQDQEEKEKDVVEEEDEEERSGEPSGEECSGEEEEVDNQDSDQDASTGDCREDSEEQCGECTLERRASGDQDESVPTAEEPPVQNWRGSRMSSMHRKLSMEDINRFKEEEETRVMLELEGEETAEIDLRMGDGLKQTVLDESTAEQTALELPRVDLDNSLSPQWRLSVASSLRAVAAMAMQTVPRRKSSVAVVPTGPHVASLASSTQKMWMASWDVIGSLFVAVDALYVLLSVPLRIGFLYNPWDNRFHRGGGGVWTNELLLLTAFDAAGELCRWRYTWAVVRRLRNRRTHVTPVWLTRRLSSINPMLLARTMSARPMRGSLFSVTDQSAKERANFDITQSVGALAKISRQNGSTTTPEPPVVVLILGIVPFELLAGLLNPNWLHLARGGKVLLACYALLAAYASLLLKSRRFRWTQWLSFSTLATPFYLFWLGLYLCHVSASGYMLIANIECGLQSQHCVRAPLPGSWVLKDNMDRAVLWRRYVRSMYWAAKTITTLGQGDLVPATELETDYCVIIQFVSGLWATAFLASCTFYFSRRDRDIENGVSTRLEQALRFLRSRKVPSTLAIQIRNYYQHIQRTRNGIEEEQALANLPGHYQFQCAFFIKYRLLAKIPFFAKQPKAFLRTVVNAMDSDFLSPGDAVVSLFDLEDLVVVARGEIAVFNQRKELVRELSAEEWFAEDALFDDYRCQFELEAATFCEIYRLSRPVFIVCMEKHFPKLRIAAVMAQQLRRPAMTTSRNEQAARPSLAAVKTLRSSKLTLLKRVSQRDGFHAVPWQHPNSAFRRKWRHWKVFLLLFHAVEVPYDIAFKWRSGFFGDDVTVSQQLVYAAAFAAELFFYVDWYLRAYRFYRRLPHHDDGGADAKPPAGGDNTPQSLRSDESHAIFRKREELATTPCEIFSLYRASGDVVYDMLAILPVSVVWSLVNRSSYSIVLREIMRCARLLALLRLSALKPVLKRIMVELDFSPASHLLANVIVFCIITANAMACYFYLLADDKDFFDAMPEGFDPSLQPVSGAQCREDATLHGNCTWFIYDRSTFGIEARYIRAMHWSLVLLSTVGYGDILSFTNSECLIGFWWIYLGALICYFTSCAVGSVVSQVTVLTAAKDRRVEEITRALVRSNVPPATRAMLRCHYEANWELNGSVLCEQNLLKRLPRSLRQQLSSTLYLHSLRTCYMFAGFGVQLQMIREIAVSMTSSIMLPGFPIVEAGHLANEMYLVQSGEVEVLLSLRFRGGTMIGNKKASFLHQQQQRHLNGRSRLHRLCAKILPSSSVRASLDELTSPSSPATRGYDRHRLKDTPIAVLKEGDCFGDEALLPHERFALRVTVRALTSTQIAVLPRDAFLHLSKRFPMQLAQMIELIMKRHEDNELLYSTIRRNLEHRDKVRDFLGWSWSVYVERATRVSGIVTPDRAFYRAWHVVHGLIVLFNFYSITFRLAFLPYPSSATMLQLCVSDYVLDAFLYMDVYLKWNHFGFELAGENVTNLFRIRQRYKDGWLKYDCLSLVPLYFYGDSFYMTLARVPRLLKSPQLLELIREIESQVRERYMRGSTTMLSLFDLLKFLVLFLSAAHHIGSIYFLLGRVLTSYGFARSSWMTVDPVIAATPGNILVQYNRAIYWCLGTFTVVCFGDVLAQNSVETVFASMTCIVGWMCIGQIVTRISSLMASIDVDRTEHNARVDNFEQYARNRKLPHFLRERAIESVEYKSKSRTDLTMRSIFRDLPPALHVLLFEGLYGDFVRAVPELAQVCSSSQIRVLANALELEIYVADDIIVEEGRLGTKLYMMKEGCAEHFSAHTRMVFAAVHKGVLFGDLAFFLTGTRQIASVRASKSCHVLQLDRHAWTSLWADDVRIQLEAKIQPTMRAKYRSVSRAYLNIIKNFELSILSGSRSAAAGLFPDSISDHQIGAAAATATSRLQMGSSMRLVQSSVASLSGKPPRATASDHSDATADRQLNEVSRPDSRQSSRTLSHAIGTLVSSSTIGTNSLSPKRRRSPKKQSVPSGGHRKLSGVLGILDVAARHQQADQKPKDLGELEWKRHERNLRELQFIDTQLQQDDEALQARATHSGNFDDHEAAAERPRVSSGGSLARTRGPSQDMSEAAKAGSHLVRADSGFSEGKAKRHSIQVNRTELTLAFRAASDSLSAAGPSRSHELRDAVVPGGPGPDPSLSLASARPPRQPSQESLIASMAPSLQASQFNPPAVQAPSGVSSRSMVSMVSDAPSSYVQHLDNLKKRSMRRHRRSVFAVINDKDADKADDNKNPYEIWIEPPLPPSFCLESSLFRRAWSAVMYVICLYYILVVPFRVSFDFEFLSAAESSTLTKIWFGLEYVMDALCIVDFWLHKTVFAFVHRGTLMTERHAIREHYLREGTYVVDLICILPLELLIPIVPFLGNAPGSTDKVTWYRVAVFRLNKMVRIAHLHSLGDKIQRMLLYDLTSLSFLRPSMIYFCRFAFDFALGAHWVACMFFAVAFNMYQPGVASWLTTPGMLTFEGLASEVDVGNVSMLMKYARSYHFSMGAITTVSYGDIAPQNAWETVAGTFVIVVSIILFGMLSGGFTRVYEMELGKRADYEEKIASVAHFMMFHRFPTRIWKHMQSYFMVHWKESQGMNEDELLDGLPLSVKKDITLFVKHEFVKQMKLFAHCEEAFVRAVVVAFGQELYVRNDVIITYGERGRRSLYVIESGHVLVRVPKRLATKAKLTTLATSASRATPSASASATTTTTTTTTTKTTPQPASASLPTNASPETRRNSGRMTFSQGADIEIIKGRFDFFGEKSLIFDVPRSATCIALSSCSMLFLSLDKYEEILREFPEYREKNMRDWIFANARENTPASAIRTPGVLAAMKSLRGKRLQPKRPTLEDANAEPAAAAAVASPSSPA